MAKKFVRTTKNAWDNLNDKYQYNDSIVFIEDAKQIWSNDIYYGDNRLIETTYDNLKILRDNSQLIPGMQYRIIDYHTTTVQRGTKSAGHQFDIIVTADSENVLNENARAIQHKSESYNVMEYGCKLGIDFFVEWGVTAEPNTGVDTLCIYKTDVDVDEGADYQDIFFYKGNYEYNGEKFDVWQKYEHNCEGYFIRNGYPHYYLTTPIVENGQIKPELYNEDTKLFYEPFDAEYILSVDNSQISDYFSNSNLNAWELKYSLDNDNSRFAWVDNLKSIEYIPIYYSLNQDNDLYDLSCSNVAIPRKINDTIQLNCVPWNYPDDFVQIYYYQGRFVYNEIEYDMWSRDENIDSDLIDEGIQEQVRYSILTPIVTNSDGTDFDWSKIKLPIINIDPEYVIMYDQDNGDGRMYSKDWSLIKSYTNSYTTLYDMDVPSQLVLFKSGKFYEIDTNSIYFYAGEYDVDGIIYDKWDEYSYPEDDKREYPENLLSTNCSILTKKIVEDGQIQERLLSENGYVNTNTSSGVIYYMKDEYGNECPYDFKNIQFVRTTEWFSKHEDWCNNVIGYIPDQNQYYYTFTWVNENNDIEDLSIIGNTSLYNDTHGISGVFNNIIKPYPNNIVSSNFTLPDNVLVSSHNYDFGLFYGCYSNTFGNNCYSNTFGNNCKQNEFGYGCYSNIFGNNCQKNKFGEDCFFNSFGESFNSNKFGNECYYNTFGHNCCSNTLGDECSSNTFGNDCYYNTFGHNCSNNTFGNDCYYNIFGNNCKQNEFGEGCYYNTFGTECVFNIFGSECLFNTFKNNCYSNTFGNNCSSNTFGNNCNSNTLGYECNSNTFGNDCQENEFMSYCAANKFGDYCRVNIFDNDCSSNIFGLECVENEFGNFCSSNKFGDECSSNTFGNDCGSNTLGDECSSNTFGHNCSNNTFGNDCNYNTFSDACRTNTFGNNCKYIKLITPDGETENIYQYYKFSSGLRGLSEDEMLEITLTPNLEYETKVAKRTNGEIVMYNEADLVP